MLLHTGDKAITSKNGLLTTIACNAKGEPEYALEGSVFIAGASIQWLRDELKIVHDSHDSEYFAQKVPDSNGVYVVPAFTGLGAPYWDPYARGAILVFLVVLTVTILYEQPLNLSLIKPVMC